MKKCSCCKCLKNETLFINKKNKETKTCEECRIKRCKQITETDSVELTETESVEFTETESVELKITETEPNVYYYLLLHNRKWRKFNREFKERASFPRHKYEMRYVFVDIRDCLTYNY
jgi:hypothetical protein